jgi:hypothetical protein
MDGNLLIEIKSEVEDELRNALAGLKPEEAAVLAMLRSRLANEFARTPAAAKSNSSIGKTAQCRLVLSPYLLIGENRASRRCAACEL